MGEKMGLNDIRKIKNKLKVIYNEKNKKPLLRIIIELIWTAIKIKSIPRHYFLNCLYRKGIDDYLDYLTKKENLKIHDVIHIENKKQILDNKLFFQKYFEKTEIAIPRMLAYNLGDMFFIKNNKIKVCNINDFTGILIEILKNSNSDSLFIKPILGAQGGNIHKITLNNITNNELGEREELINKICSENFIFQETVTQHPDINKIYSQSLNTVRIDTFINDDGEPEIISALMRVGQYGSYTDNISAGGIFIGINLETGCLNKNGLTYLKYGAKVFTRHPNSEILFENFKIPFFNEVKKTAKEAAYLLQDRLVGWDIGISDKGPVLVEGNAYYDFTCMQMAYGGYRKHPVFKNVIDIVGLR
jgi:hypothetical protein